MMSIKIKEEKISRFKNKTLNLFAHNHSIKCFFYTNKQKKMQLKTKKAKHVLVIIRVIYVN